VNSSLSGDFFFISMNSSAPTPHQAQATLPPNTHDGDNDDTSHDADHHADHNAGDEPDSEQPAEHPTKETGKLKIFLGMASGVGKTYAMLQEARDLRDEGKDIVLGIINTHDREETAMLVEGLERIPPKRTNGGGGAESIHTQDNAQDGEELDVDAVLTRKPAIVLVDELAHANPPGSRNAKRFQDVQEFLEAGIDVFATLNVQHLESRADTVKEVTGVEVRETLPDSVIEEADDIELVDIAPDELLKRLAEGQIVPLDKLDEPTRQFYRKGNLTALREMALRLAAERVDKELRDYKQEQKIQETWKSSERLLVAVSASPYSEPLVRWTRRMAYTMDASWIALSVQTLKPLNDAAQTRLTNNLELARELGAEIVSTTDEDVVAAVLRVARQENVSQIIIGKPPKQTLWGKVREMMRGGGIVERLIQESGTIDVHVVRVEASKDAPPVKPQEQSFFIPEIQSGMRDYVGTAMLSAFVGLLCFVLYEAHLISYQIVGVLLLFAVTMMALLFGRGPVIFSAILSAAFWNYFFIPPVYTWQIAKIEDALTVCLYVIVAVVAGTLTSRTRAQQRAVQQREERSAALQGLSVELAAASTKNDVLYAAVQHFEETFNADVAFFLAKVDESGEVMLNTTAHKLSSFRPTPREESVAQWAFANRKHAGKFTDTLATAQAYYVPMLSPRGCIGVVGVRFAAQMANPTTLPVEQQTLIEGFVSQITSALERETLSEKSRKTSVSQESKRVSGMLVSAIASEFQTPLTTIAGVAEELQQEVFTSRPIKELGSMAQQSVRQMQRLLENLQTMSRLASEDLPLSEGLNEEWYGVRDLLSTVTTRLESELAQHPISILIAPNTPLVRMDATLMEQALLNIVHNAALYAPAGTAIELAAELRGAHIVLEITDRGPGAPQNTLDQLFDKFYRLPNTRASGTGIGLAVAKGIVNAHKGTITAENRVGGGLKVTITLPFVPEPKSDIIW
jgi:two-component system sensor histidine kinase KdpD